jgi:glycosyltransferase involved in cell wall biosynthesis
LHKIYLIADRWEEAADEDAMKVLYLALPLREGTGGHRRDFEVLRRMVNYDVQPVLVIDEPTLKKMTTSGLLQCFEGTTIYSVKRLTTQAKYSILARAIGSLLEFFSILKTSALVSAIAKKEHVELIVSDHEGAEYILEAYMAAKRCSLPWTCVLLLPVVLPYVSTTWRKVALDRRLHRLALYFILYRYAVKAMMNTTPLAVSPSIELDMKRYLPSWKGKTLVLVPGGGVDFGKINQIAPAKEKMDGIFFSRLVPEKGILEIPLIVREMLSLFPAAKVAVVGKFGSIGVKQEFMKIINSYKLDNNIIYKGFLSDEDLYSLLKSSKVFIYPSRFDAFPVVILETLACGTPVVAYDISAVRLNYPLNAVRTVRVGNNQGMAAEAVEIIKDDKLREALSQEALSFASRYTWDNATKEERHAYDSIIENKKSLKASVH